MTVINHDQPWLTTINDEVYNSHSHGNYHNYHELSHVKPSFTIKIPLPPSFADQQDAIQDAKILHWTGPLKPWLSAAVQFFTGNDGNCGARNSSYKWWKRLLFLRDDNSLYEVISQTYSW